MRPAQEPPAQKPPTQEPLPTPAVVVDAAGFSASEVPQPDADVDTQSEQADLDARLIGMSVMLRCALRLMKSYDASPGRRNHGR
jgi:hypothetical protein